jgi:hypothetical protein
MPCVRSRPIPETVGDIGHAASFCRRATVGEYAPSVTLVWFLIWLVADNWGDREPLRFDPVNWWAGTLILVAAIDLGRQHVPKSTKQG